MPNAHHTPRTVAVTGASGLIGRALAADFAAAGTRVVRLVRRPPQMPDEIRWDPEAGLPDPAGLAGIDALVHLAGENVGSGRWTAARKARIRSSRVDSTRALVASLARVRPPPAAFVCASAIGFYGNRGDELLTEASPPGRGFLADVCRDWEAAAAAAADAGLRSVSLRFGAVLAPDGGMLAKLLTPMKLGVGGPIGDGRQWVSWVTISDVVRAVRFVAEHSALRGPVNVVAPRPVTLNEFMAALGRVLGRPAAMRMPAWAARLAFGELADEVLLASVRVSPQILQESGFTFDDPELEPALRRLLSVPR